MVFQIPQQGISRHPKNILNRTSFGTVVGEKRALSLKYRLWWALRCWGLEFSVFMGWAKVFTSLGSGFWLLRPHHFGPVVGGGSVFGLGVVEIRLMI